MPLPVVAAVAGAKGAVALAKRIRGKGGKRVRAIRRRRRRTLSNGERGDIGFLVATLGPKHGYTAVQAYLTSRR